MVSPQNKATAAYRKRLKKEGLTRVELHVRTDDAKLLRQLAKALSTPDREREVRAALREQVAEYRPDLKTLLASAPLEGVDLSREDDAGRNIDL